MSYTRYENEFAVQYSIARFRSNGLMRCRIIYRSTDSISVFGHRVLHQVSYCAATSDHMLQK
jgi:hypothetical protein